MKQITITLPDNEAGKFVANLMEMNVTFTVATTVARDPVVFAAAEALPPPEKPTIAKIGAGASLDKRGRVVQRFTADGRTAMQVVEAKVATYRNKRFHIDDIRALSKTTGFTHHTIQTQLQTLVGKGRLVKITRSVFQAVPQEAPPPPPEAMELDDKPAEFANGEGWREPAEVVQ